MLGFRKFRVLGFRREFRVSSRAGGSLGGLWGLPLVVSAQRAGGLL